MKEYRRGRPRVCPSTEDQLIIGQLQWVAPALLLSDIVHRFKTLTTKRYIDRVKQNKWQRNYYDHIIRDEISHDKISEYIINNPRIWQDDEYYS